jgi:hypothetical protein
MYVELIANFSATTESNIASAACSSPAIEDQPTDSFGQAWCRGR